MKTLRFGHGDEAGGPVVCVVAEIGVNHDGSVEVAKRLMEGSVAAGADAVKFQCFDPATLLSGDGALAEYQKGAGGSAGSARAMLEGLRLAPEDLLELRKFAEGLGVGFVVTPFSVSDVAVLGDLGLDAVKVASPDAVNPLLLEAAAGLGVPMLVSTGTCDLEELGFAAELLRGHLPGGACSGGLLHCVSAYPTPVAGAGLGGIGVLRDWLLKQPVRGVGLGVAGVPAVGYSDHTGSLAMGAWAVCAGACVLEKHVTHDRGAAGPDHAASLEAAELGEYVRAARLAAAAVGPRVKRCTEAERDVRAVSRQSLAYAGDFGAGHVLRAGDLETRRPGDGVPAAEAGAWVGRRLVRAVRAGTRVERGDAPRQ